MLRCARRESIDPRLGLSVADGWAGGAVVSNGRDSDTCAVPVAWRGCDQCSLRGANQRGPVELIGWFT